MFTELIADSAAATKDEVPSGLTVAPTRTGGESRRLLHAGSVASVTSDSSATPRTAAR